MIISFFRLWPYFLAAISMVMVTGFIGWILDVLDRLNSGRISHRVGGKESGRVTSV